VRIELLVEGATEQVALPSFFKRWLDERLPAPISVKPVSFKGNGQYLTSFAQRVNRDLEFSEKIAAVGLLDLYGATLESPPNADKYAWAKPELESRVGHPRFRQHFAVHEVEAWLLSDPKIFPEPVRKRLAGASHRPESVNFRKPPSKLLQQVYLSEKRTYKKTLDGRALFNKLDPNMAYEKCPYR